MTRRRLVPLVALLGLVAPGCGDRGGEPSAAPAAAPRTAGAPSKLTAEARAAADALAGELMGRLVDELGRGGPAAAIEVCAAVAQEIAAEHSRAGFTVRRVSSRTRNPANAPDAYERSMLDQLERAHADGALPAELVELEYAGGRRRVRYLRPIVVAAPCLACHGDPAGIDPAVRAALATRYPGDRAVGYAAGDLRGAVSVTIDLP
jgi:hypothetical protein